MTSPSNPQILIEVTLTPSAGKPSGYQFSYASSSGLVDPDGSIDLSNYDKSDVQLLFDLQTVGGQQPTFAMDPAHPASTDAAVWFAEWPKELPPPAPCPTSPGHANSSFKSFSLPQIGQLQFTNKNKDNRRYAYALRCVVPPSIEVIADDPVIINKIGLGPA